jgi:hypothetical protein
VTFDLSACPPSSSFSPGIYRTCREGFQLMKPTSSKISWQGTTSGLKTQPTPSRTMKPTACTEVGRRVSRWLRIVKQAPLPAGRAAPIAVMVSSTHCQGRRAGGMADTTDLKSIRAISQQTAPKRSLTQISSIYAGLGDSIPARSRVVAKQNEKPTDTSIDTNFRSESVRTQQ